MNNALNGRKLKGLGFVLLALSVDPREVGKLLMFLLLLHKTRQVLAGGFQRYSIANQLNSSGNLGQE